MKEKSKKLNVDDLFLESFSKNSSDNIESITISKPKENRISCGEINHNDIRISGLDISVKGLKVKVEKFQTGKWFTVALSVMVTLVTVALLAILIYDALI
ncbi:MAG: hypothetical protein ACKE5M_08110 [Methylophilaceae bacterium]